MVNFSPPGFQYSTNNPDPAASQSIAVVKTIADQLAEDMHGERSFLNPTGMDRIPEHRGPGRYSNNKSSGSRNHKK